MNDRELCETFGISPKEVEREVDRVESGDYSSWDFSRAMMGSPIDNDRLEMISAPVGESRIKAMKRITDETGMTRAEFVRRAIDHELLAMS